MPRLTRRSAASKEEATPEKEEITKTTSRSRSRGTKQVEVSTDEPQETPAKRGGRQPVKAKAMTPKKGKSPASGRSTSRSTRGNKQEEKEEEQEQAGEEEAEEEEQPKGSTRSRGKEGRGATKGGRASNVKAAEDKKEAESEKDAEDISDSGAKASSRKNKKSVTPRGGRSRGKAGSEPAEEEQESKEDESKNGDEPAVAPGSDVSTEPKGRQKRTPNQKQAASATPPSSGRRGRGQKKTESQPTQEGLAATETESSKEEAMETTEEEAKPQEDKKPEEEPKPEESSLTTEETKEAESSPGKKRKLEEEGEREVKRIKVVESEPPAEEDKEDDLTDYVVVNKDEVPAPESKEVDEFLPPAISSESDSAGDEPMPAAADVTSRVDTTDANFVVPLTEAELAKQYAPKQKEETDETSSTLVEVGSEAASDITGVSRGLDFSDAVSLDSSISAEQPDQPAEVPTDNPRNSLEKDSSEFAEVTMEKQASAETDEPDTAIDQSDAGALPTESANNLDSLHNSGYNALNIQGSYDILNRKFILNKAVPAELMDPAYCFSVVSYNILADCHLKRGDYAYVKPQFLETVYRHFLLMKELTYLDGDIVCLQEVNPSYYDSHLLPEMIKRGYTGSFMKRTKDYWDEGAATFVRKSKFAVVSSQSISLRDLAYKAVDGLNLNSEISEAAKKYLDRADVILLTQVKFLKTNEIITICNIHVLYDLEALDVQCIEVACAIKELVTNSGSDLNPHIICGDFNSPYNSPAYQLVQDGYLIDNNIKKLQAIKALELTDNTVSKAIVNHMWGAFQHTSSSLQSAYYTIMQKEPLCTTYTKSCFGTLDYIFFSSLSLHVIGVLETLDDKVVRRLGGLPSSSVPSDHLSLKAVFRTREEKN
ncbi:DNA ligase 1-like isoform X3 [Biomphalaria pfeifferi]|uniref:DNA ligase 1-like isoform X3 n=1 Tax=Biomphalaria pfeifferi TaxID=112525 RepID=A0AAD8APM7_BIOPF|nr:DNA ligase 1-like isoform X3 [Biomphalaria pfeifferi]